MTNETEQPVPQQPMQTKPPLKISSKPLTVVLNEYVNPEDGKKLDKLIDGEEALHANWDKYALDRMRSSGLYPRSEGGSYQSYPVMIQNLMQKADMTGDERLSVAEIGKALSAIQRADSRLLEELGKSGAWYNWIPFTALPKENEVTLGEIAYAVKKLGLKKVDITNEQPLPGVKFKFRGISLEP